MLSANICIENIFIIEYNNIEVILMDELLAAGYKVAVQLVPILGAVVLGFLIYLIRHCVTFIKELTVMVQKASSALEGIDKSVDKLQAPLDTVVKISGTIDQVQESAVGAVKNVAGFMAGNLDSIKEATTAWTAKKKPQGTCDEGRPSDPAGTEPEVEPVPEVHKVQPVQQDNSTGSAQTEGGNDHE